MHKRKNISLAAMALVVAALAWACEQPVTAPLPEADATLSDNPLDKLPIDKDKDPPHPCPVQKFTGGGRIDPGGEKFTFGFNVHADEDCNPIKGQLQMVHHPTQTKYHSTSITAFSSRERSDGSACGEWEGTVRVKHGNGSWHEHDFRVEACDNGEPGSAPGTGPDTFRATVPGTGPGHGDTGRTPLTGGNIQAH